MIRLARDVQGDSIVDGEGLRAVVWLQGCEMKCKGCHNPDTWNLKGGKLVEIDSVISTLAKFKGQRGVTFSGGEPMLQAGACAKIAEWARGEMGWDVWCFTGLTYEEILEGGGDKCEFLKRIDVLVDGRFDINQRDISLRFRGSKNQRIIRVIK